MWLDGVPRSRSLLVESGTSGALTSTGHREDADPGVLEAPKQSASHLMQQGRLGGYEMSSFCASELHG